MKDVLTLLETAESAARVAGELAREKWAQPRQTSSKGFRDLVTDADVACQQVITNLIRARFPDHGFLTEEEDSYLPTSGPVLWVIDPIDGTTNYSRQNPVFCVSVAAVVVVDSNQYLVDSNQYPVDSNQYPVGGRQLISNLQSLRVNPPYHVLAGAIYDPMRDELFSAGRGGGAWMNKRPISRSPVETLGEAVVSLDWSHASGKRQEIMAVLNRFAEQVFTVRAIGSAALAIAWIAAGRLDVYVNLNLSPWDFAAGSLILQEAGGHITNLSGGPLGWQVNGNGCVASNGRIHDTFLQQIGGE